MNLLGIRVWKKGTLLVSEVQTYLYAVVPVRHPFLRCVILAAGQGATWPAAGAAVFQIPGLGPVHLHVTCYVNNI